MTVMTSREFNQHLGAAQMKALTEPVVVTKRGEPVYVLMSYEEYEKILQEHSFRSIADVLADSSLDAGGVELDFPSRRGEQRKPVDLED